MKFTWSPVEPLVLMDDLDQAEFWVDASMARHCPEDTMRGQVVSYSMLRMKLT